MIGAVLLLAALTEAQQLAHDGVLSYKVPQYMGPGKAVVTVMLLRDGTIDMVGETKREGMAGYPEVQGWKFAPGSERRVNVTFIFEEPRETDCDHSTKSWYESPLTLHIQPAAARGYCLPRVNGVVPAKECEVHHVTMKVERVPLRHYGPPLPPEMRDHSRDALNADYAAHSQSEFPHAVRFAGAGDAIGSETWSEAYVCRRCLEAEKAWRDAHDGYEP